jgi:hypothetical protein
LKHLAVHLSDEKLEPLVGDLEVLFPPRGELARQPLARLRQRKRIADAMNHYMQSDRPKSEALATALLAHQQKLAAQGLTIHSPVIRKGGLFARTLLDLLWLAVFAVPAIAGTIHHIIPYLLIRLITPHVKTPGRTTISTARLLLGLPLYALAYAAAFLLMWHCELPGWAICAWLASMPLAGIIALEYWSRAKAAIHLWWLQVKLTRNKDELQRLRADQAGFESQLQQLAEEYQTVSTRC